MPGIAVLGLETPVPGVELELLGVVGHGEIDVPQVGDEPFGHWVAPRIL